MATKYLLILILGLLLSSNLISQDYLKRERRFKQNKKLFVATNYLPKTQDSACVLVLYRFTYDLISFEKYDINSGKYGKFFSVPKFEIEFEDERGIIRQRGVWEDTIETDSFDKVVSKKDFIRGGFFVDITQNCQKAKYRLSDQSSKNIRLGKRKDSLICDKSVGSSIGEPIYASKVNQNGSAFYYPYILNKKAEFSSKNLTLLIPILYDEKSVKYSYVCRYHKEKSEQGLIFDSDYRVTGVKTAKPNVEIQLDYPNSKDYPRLKIANVETEKPNKPNIGFLEIPLSRKEAYPGGYELKIIDSETGDTTTRYFEMIWEDKPAVLNNLDLAIETMYYVLTEDEHEELEDLNEVKASKWIIDYWKKKDPSPATAYNEAMAEYFKRADYAYYNFKTPRKKNGIETDKGKIYILYGPPDKKEKKLEEDETYEIWKYLQAGKAFKFKLIGTKRWKLIDAKGVK